MDNWGSFLDKIARQQGGVSDAPSCVPGVTLGNKTRIASCYCEERSAEQSSWITPRASRTRRDRMGIALRYFLNRYSRFQR
jgi:hypothetical protein